MSPGAAANGETSITVTYYQALGADPTNPITGATGTPNPNYTQFEQFTLTRPRSDGPGVGVAGAAPPGLRGGRP